MPGIAVDSKILYFFTANQLAAVFSPHTCAGIERLSTALNTMTSEIDIKLVRLSEPSLDAWLGLLGEHFGWLPTTVRRPSTMTELLGAVGTRARVKEGGVLELSASTAADEEVFLKIPADSWAWE
ncbi:MAG: hypothetical protein C0607_20205 [Azoarcus sp.]|nr:MAG: hypothetical protein C0607_20205 [Azoarcus sp.]